jgi:phosphatidylglycerophosphate synthase
MNIANRLTVLRIILTFVFMFFLFIQGVWAKVIALAVFIFAALSDYFDGRIAKKRNMVTDFGKLMDPIADKSWFLRHLQYLSRCSLSRPGCL